MHKQDNTTTDKGLESIMESMYKEAPGQYIDWDQDERNPDNPDNTEYQIADPELDDAAHGSLINWINKQAEANPAFVQKLIQFIQDTEGISRRPGQEVTGRVNNI
jgi:hypothetical protein